MKKPSVFLLHEQLKDSSHVDSQTKIMLITFLDIKLYCSLWIHSTRPNSQPIL